jgi:hypothetical protein
MSRLGVEFFPQFFENGIKSLDVYSPPEFIQNLDKTAHVGAFEAAGEIDVHVDGGVGRLCAVRAVEDNNGVFDALYAHFLYIKVSVVFLVLNV